MTVWVLIYAHKILHLIDSYRRNELLQKLEISQDELKRWNEISRKMYIPMTDNGIILQFDGYDRLLKLDMDLYRKKYGNIERMDRILDAEGDSVNRYKVTKQPDVLMLFYLFSHEELAMLFKRLAYDYSKCDIKKHIEYYNPQTTLGSSLSQIVNSWVIACCDREKSWKYFYESLKSDFEEGQQITTSEGIHLGSLAGTVDIIQRGYTGLVIRDNVLWLNPLIPANSQMKCNCKANIFN